MKAGNASRPEICGPRSCAAEQGAPLIWSSAPQGPVRQRRGWGRPLLGFALALGVIAVPAAAQENDPTAFAGAADVQAQVAEMEQAMTPEQGFLWRPLVRGGESVAALEIWKKPGRPAVHPDEAEYAIVIAGSGTLVSGGTLADAKVSKPGLTEGSRIDGGTTRSLGPGDVLLIPAGTPHWFGITGGKLVLLGTKLPAAAPK